MEKGDRLQAELTRSKELRGFHWEQTPKLETIDATQA
jgi:hypothetical protein